jgi:glucose uptake protein GlcU
MSEIIPILKDEHNQQPIPTAWRSTLFHIVEGLKVSNFDQVQNIEGIRPISAQDTDRISRSIQLYGAQLISLPDETWNTSVCQWMIGYWDVLVDLYTIEEHSSDLALALRVYEDGQKFCYEIRSVYVP